MIFGVPKADWWRPLGLILSGRQFQRGLIVLPHSTRAAALTNTIKLAFFDCFPFQKKTEVEPLGLGNNAKVKGKCAAGCAYQVFERQQTCLATATSAAFKW